MGEKAVEKEVRVRSFLLTPKVIAAYLILIVLSIPTLVFSGYVDYRWWYGYPYLIIFISATLTLLIGPVAKLKPQELTMIYVLAMMTTSLSVVTQWYWTGFLPFLPWGGDAYDKVRAVIPPLFVEMVPKSVLDDMLPGGKPFPLESWIPALLTLLCLHMLVYVWGLGWSTLFSKRFIREEKLSFPYAIPTYTLINSYDRMVSTKRSWLFTKEARWFWLGFLLLGCLGEGIYYILTYSELALGGTVNPAIPWFSTSTWGFSTDFRWLDPYLPGADLYWPEGGWGFFMWLPISLLLPLDILATAFVWYFWWYWFYPAIGNTMGLFPTKMSWDAIHTGRDPSLVFSALHANFGIMLAIAAVTIYSGRDFLMNSLRNAFRRVKAEPGDISDFLTWLLIGATSILFIVVWVAIGANIIAIIYYLIVFTVWTIGRMRVRAETHWGLSNPPPDVSMDIGPLIGWANPQFTTDVAATRLAVGFLNGMWSREWATDPGYWNEAFKIAEETHTPRRDIFVGIIFSSIVALIIGWIGSWWLGYYWGVAVAPKPGWWVRGIMTGSGRSISDMLSIWTVTPGTYQSPLFWQSAGIGFVITVAIYFARLRFPWLWINPIGFLLLPNSWWVFATLAAFVIKFIVIRIGGTDAYNKYLLPFAIGAFVGRYTGMYFIRWIARGGVSWYIWMSGGDAPLFTNLLGGWPLIPVILYFALPIAALIAPPLLERRQAK